ncbi:response regulator [Flavobacterium sp.]|uniref:response regulator n=1 Tax=Flavobacterium sp. TaxID=239 RepID=UPI0026137E7B|nr:response regulator [Flavobacterium sp.]
MLFILIDDDPIFNYIHEKTIRNSCPECSVLSFVSSREALEHVIDHYSEKKGGSFCLLLDINMPEYNGFEFLDRLLKRLPNFLIEHPIYILTSSLNEKDRQRAAQYPDLKGYLEKPLNRDQLTFILEKLKL